MAVQREIRDQVLKLRVLLTQLPELAQLAQAQSRILLLPNVERGFADPVFPADVGHSAAALRLAQGPYSALPSVPSSPPACPPRARPQDHACRTKLNLSLARFSGFGSTL